MTTGKSAIRASFSLTLCSLLLGGCSLAPSYTPPALSSASHYKETGAWVAAAQHAQADTSAWWQAFGDPQLNALEQQAAQANQNIAAARAHLDQARALARAQRAAQSPQLTASAAHENARVSENKPLFPKSINPSYQDNALGLDLAYELDLWGALRNASAASAALATARADDLAALELSTQAELAMDYFTLRGTDAELAMLHQLDSSWQQNSALTQQLYGGGQASQSDLALARQNQQNAATQVADLQLKRSQLEHAIALITGANPDSFALTPVTLFDVQPLNPEPGLPSTLLERRPDIASAERTVAAANAEIGVARAAYFPVFSLNAAIGFESTSAANWLSVPNRFWSFGPSAAAVLFDDGRLQALSDQARAQWREAAANYRNSVLTAWREVEDNLAAQQALALEFRSSQAASEAAHESLKQAQYRYQGGIASNFDVLTSERAALQTDLASTDIQIRRITASILLVKALGGDWRHNATHTAKP